MSSHLPVLHYGSTPPTQGDQASQQQGSATPAHTTKGILKHTSSIDDKSANRNAPSSSAKKKLTRVEQRRVLVYKHMERLLEHGAADMGKLLTMAASFSAEEMLQVAEERKLAQLCGYPLCQQPPARRKSIRDRFEYDATVKDLVNRPEDYFSYCSPACRACMHRLTDKLGSVDDALRRFELQRSQNECIRPGSLGVVSREELVSRDQLVQQDGGVGAGGAGSTGGGEAQPLRNVRFADDATGSSHGTTSTPAAATTATPAAGTAAAEAQGSVEGTVVSHGVPPSATHKKDAPPLRPHILGQVMERTPTTTASPTTTKSTTASATTANPTTASATGAATDVAADVAAGMQQLSLVHEASAIENGSGDVEEEAYGEDEEGSEYATDSEFGEEQDEEEDELTRASQLLAYWQQKGGGAGVPPNLSSFGRIYTLLAELNTSHTGPWVTDTTVPDGPPIKMGDDGGELRRKVVLKMLREQMPHLLRSFQVASIAEQVDQQLAWLLDTMHFAKHAPVLKASEWQLLALVALKALSLHRVPGLQDNMDGRDGLVNLQHQACRLGSSVEEVTELLSVLCGEE